MELKDLVGLHKLSGVDMGNEQVKEEWGDSFEDCQVINFVLDEKTYAAIEDPSDGYRSSMREVRPTNAIVKNRFSPVRVMGIMRRKTDYENRVLDFYDTKTALPVLSVGTENFDDYYPCFVATFTPENMVINQ